MTGKEGMTVRNKKKASLIPLLASVLSITALFASALLPVSADELGFAYRNSETGYSVYISDEADLLTDDEEKALIDDMAPVTEYGNIGFVSCENTSVSTKNYAAQIYSSVFGSASGTMLVIDMGQRQLYIKNNGDVSKSITNAYSNTISDNIYRYASKGEFYECAAAYSIQVYTVLEGGRITQSMRFITAALLAVILGLLINYLIIRSVTARRKAGNAEIIDAAKVDFILRDPSAVKDHTTRVYSPVRSSGGGGGGGHGGGGGGGGGSGGGHGF